MDDYLVQTLNELGLSDSEVKIAKTIYLNPGISASQTAKLSGIRSSVIYYNLDRLTQRGFIHSIVKNEKKIYYFVELPAVREMLNNKRQRINLLEKNLEKIPLLNQAVEAGQVSVKFFEGWKGVLGAFFEAINSAPANSKAYSFVIGKLNQVELYRKEEIILKITEERRKKSIITNVIITESAIKTIGRLHQRQGGSIIRVIGDEFENPAVINVYGSKVLIGIYEDEMAAILINNKKLADSFERYFKVLWAMSKPLEK